MHTFRGIPFILPPTDNQRQRCYNAENEVFTGRPIEFKTRRGVQGRANRILKSSTVQKLRQEFGLPPKSVEIQLRRANSRSTSYGGLIVLSKTSMTTWVLLHELAHEIAPQGSHHHWPFIYCYLKLVSRFMGAETAKALKAAFKKHKVRKSPSRKRTLV